MHTVYLNLLEIWWKLIGNLVEVFAMAKTIAQFCVSNPSPWKSLGRGQPYELGRSFG